MSDSAGHATDLEAVRDAAEGLQDRIRALLAAEGADKIPTSARRAARAGVAPSRDVGDPEFTKNLRIVARLIAEGVRLCERSSDSDALPAWLRVRLQNSILGEGGPRASDPLFVSVEGLLADRFELERLLIHAGDDEYLRTRAGELYDEGPGTTVHWRDLFDEAPPLLDVRGAEKVTGPAGTRAREQTRMMLNRAIAAKETEDFLHRARRELKRRVLCRSVLPMLLLSVAAFAVTIALLLGDDVWRLTLAAGAAGAAGASLGGFVALRDDIDRGAQIREFVPLLVGRVTVGVAAGLLALVVTESGAVQVGGGDAGLAGFAFALGFSEAAFLRLVTRIGSAGDDVDVRGEAKSHDPPTMRSGGGPRVKAASLPEPGSYHVVASFTVPHPEDEARFIQAAHEDARLSMATEDGTLRMELLQDENGTGHYILDEAYADLTAFQEHERGPQFTRFFEIVEELGVRWHEVFRGNRIEVEGADANTPTEATAQ